MKRERNAVLDRIERELPAAPDAFERLRDHRERKVVRRRVGGAVVGLVVTGALILAIFAVIPPRNDQSTEVEPAGSPVTLVAEPGQFYYVRITGPDSPPTTNERWFSPDGAGRFTTRVGDELVDARSFSPGELTAKLYSSLSTDPEVLVTQLLERSAPGGASPIAIPSTPPYPGDRTAALLSSMDSLLTFGSDYLVPEQTAAVFQAARGVDGVTTRSGQVDLAGRSATVLSWIADTGNGSMTTMEWFFEPSTGQFMGERRIDLETGQVMSASIIEQAGITDSTRDRPRAASSYVPPGSAPPATYVDGDPPAAEPAVG